MNSVDFANWVSIAITFLGNLPKAIDTIKSFTTKNGFVIKGTVEEIDKFKGSLYYKKSREEKKRCKVLLKKHNLPKSVGIMCKSQDDICFIPNKAIVDKNLNNLHLKSNDGASQLHIGGGFFAFATEVNVSGFCHSKIMNGTVIKHNDEIYLLRHPLGGFPFYLAKLELFINGVIIEFDDGSKVGLYY